MRSKAAHLIAIDNLFEGWTVQSEHLKLTANTNTNAKSSYQVYCALSSGKTLSFSCCISPREFVTEASGGGRTLSSLVQSLGSKLKTSGAPSAATHYQGLFSNTSSNALQLFASRKEHPQPCTVWAEGRALPQGSEAALNPGKKHSQACTVWAKGRTLPQGSGAAWADGNSWCLRAGNALHIPTTNLSHCRQPAAAGPALKIYLHIQNGAPGCTRERVQAFFAPYCFLMGEVVCSRHHYSNRRQHSWVNINFLTERAARRAHGLVDERIVPELTNSEHTTVYSWIQVPARICCTAAM